MNVPPRLTFSTLRKVAHLSNLFPLVHELQWDIPFSLHFEPCIIGAANLFFLTYPWKYKRFHFKV